MYGTGAMLSESRKANFTLFLVICMYSTYKDHKFNLITRDSPYGILSTDTTFGQ